MSFVTRAPQIDYYYILLEGLIAVMFTALAQVTCFLLSTLVETFLNTATALQAAAVLCRGRGLGAAHALMSPGPTPDA